MTRYFGTTAVDGTMTVAQVALAVLRKHFAAMLDNEAGTIEGKDPERLHDMRVASRRMRSAFATFKAWVPESVAVFREDLKWIGGALGAVRDLDVQLGHHRQWAADLGNEAELEPWFDVLAALRAERRGRLVSELRSERYARFVEGMGDALLRAETDPGAPPIGASAPALVKRRWKRLKKAMAALNAESPDQELHAARILAKRFRYSVEFVAPVYGPPAKETATATAKLQDVLGLHQDCAVAEQMVRELMTEGPARLPAIACFELGRLVDRAQAVKREQRALAKPTFEAVRQGPWPALKALLAAQREDEAPEQPAENQKTET